MTWIVSDRGPRFTSSITQTIVNDISINQHFTTAYFPWVNGTVEQICKEVLRATKASLSEWKLPPIKWSSIIESIMAILNQAPLKRLSKKQDGEQITWSCLMEVFTGLKSKRFEAFIILPEREKSEAREGKGCNQC